MKSHGKSATFRQHYYPEGGWGWVITFCCFIANLFTTGLQLTFGLLIVQIQRQCGNETSEISIGKTILDNYIAYSSCGLIQKEA